MDNEQAKSIENVESIESVVYLSEAESELFNCLKDWNLEAAFTTLQGKFFFVNA